MTNARVVTFDIANATFDYYTEDMWNSQVQSWRDELELDSCCSPEDVANMDEYEVVECMWGEEVFIDYIPEEVK